jgi:ribose 5-phosphate isomerase RpiB
MADVATALRGGDGVAFLVSAGIVYEIIAAACSSPQTTEINAGARSATLMKWVNLGVGQAILFVAIAAWLDRRHAGPILAGGALAAALMYGQYMHARAAGLRSSEPGTESY